MRGSPERAPVVVSSPIGTAASHWLGGARCGAMRWATRSTRCSTRLETHAPGRDATSRRTARWTALASSKRRTCMPQG